MPPVDGDQIGLPAVDIARYLHPVKRVEAMHHPFIGVRKLFIAAGIILRFAREKESGIEHCKIDQLNFEVLLQLITQMCQEDGLPVPVRTSWPYYDYFCFLCHLFQEIVQNYE